MTYVELDVEDEMYEKLQELADEEGMSTEELIIDILKDEISYTSEGDDDLLDDDDLIDDDINNTEEFEN